MNKVELTVHTAENVLLNFSFVIFVTFTYPSATASGQTLICNNKSKDDMC